MYSPSLSLRVNQIIRHQKDFKPSLETMSDNVPTTSTYTELLTDQVSNSTYYIKQYMCLECTIYCTIGCVIDTIST